MVFPKTKFGKRSVYYDFFYLSPSAHGRTNMGINKKKKPAASATGFSVERERVARLVAGQTFWLISSRLLPPGAP